MTQRVARLEDGQHVVPDPCDQDRSAASDRPRGQLRLGNGHDVVDLVHDETDWTALDARDEDETRGCKRGVGPVEVEHGDDLPAEIRQSSGDDGQFVRLKLGASLKEAEKELIQATLNKAKGNKAKAARLLGIGRKTLYQKMKEYKMQTTPQGENEE